MGQDLGKENSIPQKSLLSAFPHKEQPNLGTKNNQVTDQECDGTTKEQPGPFSSFHSDAAYPPACRGIQKKDLRWTHENMDCDLQRREGTWDFWGDLKELNPEGIYVARVLLYTGPCIGLSRAPRDISEYHLAYALKQGSEHSFSGIPKQEQFLLSGENHSILSLFITFIRKQVC